MCRAYYPQGTAYHHFDARAADTDDTFTQTNVGRLKVKVKFMAVMFSKYSDLIRFLGSAQVGRTYQDIRGHLGVSDSTARRMIRELRELLHVSEDDVAETGEKRFKLLGLPWQTTDPEYNVRDLELAADLLEREGLSDQAARVRWIKNHFVGAMKRAEQVRLAPDLEILQRDEAWAGRPRPKAEVDGHRLRSIRAALLAQHRLRVQYRSRGDQITREFVLEPHGLLFGQRNYVIAFVSGSDSPEPLMFAIAHCEKIELLDERFDRRPNFDLTAYASRSFGVWQGDGPFNVVWRFSGSAAQEALEFMFHPTEIKQILPDGRVEVRFQANGLLEMCFNLFEWEEPSIRRSVDIVEPQILRSTYRTMLQHALTSLNAAQPDRPPGQSTPLHPEASPDTVGAATRGEGVGK